MEVRQTAVASHCVAIVMNPNNRRTLFIDAQQRRSNSKAENGYRIFLDFVNVNRSTMAWNVMLLKSLDALEFVGFVRPGTLLVSAPNAYLEQLRNAWVRRILKPPPGFAIRAFGNVDGIEMQEVPQTQFVPLSDVLSSIISSMNRIGQPATIRSITDALRHQYFGITMPKEDMIYAAIGGLMAQGHLYSMGNHYFIASAIGQPNTAAFYLDYANAWTGADSYPPAPITKDNKESQTGASIINGPNYKPKAKKKVCDAATSTTLEPVKEKVSKWTRFFGRAKPKQSDVEPTVQVVRTAPTSANTHYIDPRLNSRMAKHDPLDGLRFSRRDMSRSRARHSIWFDERARGEHRKVLESHAAKQRFSTRFEEAIHEDDEDGYRDLVETIKPTRRTRRMSKHLSSSSECIQYIGPQTKRYGKIYQDFTPHMHKNHHLRLHNISARLNIETSSVLKPNADIKQSNGQMTASTPVQPVTTNNQKKENRDSALSVSPIITDASSSETKFSSWSGSEEHRNGARPQPQALGNHKKVDHTYVNDVSLRKVLAGDNTYENLSFAVEKLQQENTVKNDEHTEEKCSAEELRQIIHRFGINDDKKFRVKTSPAYISVL